MSNRADNLYMAVMNSAGAEATCTSCSRQLKKFTWNHMMVAMDGRYGVVELYINDNRACKVMYVCYINNIT